MKNQSVNPLYEKFNGANSRISETNATIEKRNEEEKSERIELIRKSTEDFSKEILGLVSDVLDTINTSSGSIDSNILHKYPSLCKTISEDSLKNKFHKFHELANESKTGYSMNDESLSIILNYSGYCECMSSTILGGASFDDTNINYDYLAELLSPYSISVEKVTKEYCNYSVGEDEYIIFLEITATKSKNLTQSPVKAYKNSKWDKYKDKHTC